MLDRAGKNTAVMELDTGQEQARFSLAERPNESDATQQLRQLSARSSAQAPTEKRSLRTLSWRALGTLARASTTGWRRQLMSMSDGMRRRQAGSHPVHIAVLSDSFPFVVRSNQRVVRRLFRRFPNGSPDSGNTPQPLALRCASEDIAVSSSDPVQAASRMFFESYMIVQSRYTEGSTGACPKKTFQRRP